MVKITKTGLEMRFQPLARARAVACPAEIGRRHSRIAREIFACLRIHARGFRARRAVRRSGGPVKLGSFLDSRAEAPEEAGRG